MATNISTALTQAQCIDLVERFLAGQDWTLAAAARLAADIWREVADDPTDGAVKTAVFRLYATLLHQHCFLDGETAEKSRSWYELRVWLLTRAKALDNHPGNQEEIVQEALLALQSARPASPPAFLAYALQTMKRKQIDLARSRTAEKRGKGRILSLEGLDNQTAEEDGRSWEESIPDESISASFDNWRTIEHVVADQEIRNRLRQFAQKQLPTDLQQQVFEALFLDGLTPAETAHLSGKQPHEIRLVKARIVKKMKALPQSSKRQLLNILGTLDPDE